MPTADLSDAAPGPIALDPRIRRVWQGAVLAGPAFTVRTPPGEHTAVRLAAERAGPGEVLVVDGGGELRYALWGDKLSKLALERGIAGVVIDGAVRDLEGIEELRFPVFALGAVPTGPAHAAPGELGVPIVCGGVAVSPGDAVYGDADGVVVVPAGQHDETLARARNS